MKSIAPLILLALGNLSCSATELITNGDFETGDFSGWTVSSISGTEADFSISTPGDLSPLSARSTSINISGGTFYALSDAFDGPGTHALFQSFTIPSTPSSVILTFQMFVDDYSGSTTVNSSTLDYNGPTNQHSRVDILTSGAGAFDTGATVLQNLYIGADPDANFGNNPYTPYSFDITSLVSTPGTYQLRFANVENQNVFVHGVDNVSVNFTAQAPEPSSVFLIFGSSIFLTLRRRSFLRNHGA